MTDLPPADQPAEGYTEWSEIPATECIECGRTFASSTEVMLHLSLDHYGNQPQSFRLALVGAAHGLALTEQGTVPIINVSFLLQYDRCDCGCGQGPGMQLANVHATVGQWRAFATALLAQTEPEAVAKAQADYVASLDAEEGPTDVTH
jgi:hypothetical protein